jgi:hypothetical protein
MSRWSVAVVATLLSALIPVMLSVGAGYYSEVRQCNQDASDMEAQQTSTLLEIVGREERMRSVLAVDKVSTDNLIPALTKIERGAEGYFDDPQFKDHSLVSLVNQYNRLIRRVQFPDDLKCAPTAKCVASGLDIDTQHVHPAIGTLDVTRADAHAFARDIDGDLQQIAQQQQWHNLYGPVRLCSIRTLIFASEPWKLVRLVTRD